MREVINQMSKTMTTLQKTTINQIKNKIKKWNPWAETVKVTEGNTLYGICDAWVNLVVRYDKSREQEVYADVYINSKGNVVKGKWDYKNPVKVNKKELHQIGI